MIVDHSIYEREDYWRDGMEGTSHGEWVPYSAIWFLFQRLFGGRLLDVGCGCGGFLQWGAVDGNYGIEISRYAVTHPLPGAEGKIIHGRLEDIPFKDNFFNMVTAFNVMEHITPASCDNILRELFRVSGKWVILAVCVSTDCKPPMEYDYMGDDINKYTERQQKQIKRGHWCMHDRDWWVSRVGALGKVRVDMEKKILDFTSQMLPETDAMWTYNSQGLIVFEKA